MFDRHSDRNRLQSRAISRTFARPSVGQILRRSSAALSNLFTQTIESFGAPWFLGLPKLPATCSRFPKPDIRSSRSFHSGKEKIEVVFQQVLQQTGCNCCPQVLILMRTPSQNKRPNGLGFLFDELPDRNDGLPACILLPIRRRPARKKLFRSGDCLLNRHRCPKPDARSRPPQPRHFSCA